MLQGQLHGEAFGGDGCRRGSLEPGPLPHGVAMLIKNQVHLVQGGVVVLLLILIRLIITLVGKHPKLVPLPDLRERR